MAAPLVSIVLPTYNRETTVLRAITSVLHQTYAPIELIVVDDASADRTAETVGGLEDCRIRLIRHDRNRGAAAARNSGVAAARGRWVAFQDSDDAWLPQKLERQVAALRELPSDYGALFCTKIDYGRDSRGTYGPRLSSCMPDPGDPVRSGDLSKRLLRGNIIGPQTALISREAFLEAGGFDERLRNNEDWDFFIRLSARRRIGFLDEPLVIVMSSPDSISRNRRYSAASFVRIFGKIRRTEADRDLLAEHASTVASKLVRVGKRRMARRYLRHALSSRPADPRPYLKYLYTFFA